MESKIEKTEWKCPACGTTKITPWYVKELEPELEGIYPETVKKIIEKVGKMLNDNSQDQEENEPEKVYVDPIVPDFIAEKLAEERYNTREILLNGTKPLEVEYTPEEWEKAKEFDKIHDILKPYHKEAEDYSDTLKRILDDREREGYEKGWDDCERFRILIDRQDEDYDSFTGKERKELARIGKELNKLNSKKK